MSAAPLATKTSAFQAADASVTRTLLRCWVREHGIDVDGQTLRLPLAERTLTVPVTAVSPSGWHRFGTPTVDGAPLDAVELVTLFADDLARRGRATASQRDDLVTRTCTSLDRIAHHIAVRHTEPPTAPLSFLAGEQELVAGHPFHPAAKDRDQLLDHELAAYSPELRGSFPLRWFAVDRELVASGSALERPAESLLADIGDRPTGPPGTVSLPMHPWQAAAVAQRRDVAELIEAGAIHDLGEGSMPWYPTSSLRTVWSADAPWMLKLSLGLRITNSRRENLRAELQLGERAHRVLAAGVGRELAAVHPTFHVVTDPAWVGVDVAGAGFETAIRHNPLPLDDRTICMASLVDERPGCGGPLLAQVLRRLAHRDGLTPDDAAQRWVRRYVECVVAPLAWLERTWGIVLEAHHQNTLVTLDEHGWPVAGWYRDSQGWYFAASAAERIRSLVPAIGDDAVFADELVTQRAAYYLGVNNIVGLVGAIASAGVAPEERLLATTRAALAELPRSPVVDLLLSADRLPCKANLLTCVDGRDELAGSVEQQSVYLEVPNPLVEVHA